MRKISGITVTVVIPAYNAEGWIAETIRTVLNQTHRNIEIVLVDDGSTDRTADVAAAALKQGECSYRIFRQANMGAAGARNRGWQSADGELVQFLDADDLLEPQKIELQLKRTAELETADVIYSDWQKLIWFNECWKPSDPRTPCIREDALADILSDRNFLQLSSLLFRTSTLKKVGGFDASHEPIEDVGLCVKIAMAGGRFAHAPSNGPLSSYRDVPRSFSKMNHVRFIESSIKNAKLAEHYLRVNQRDAPRVVQAIVDVYFAGARFFAGLDWRRFEELVADIEALSPDFVPRAPTQLAVLSRLLGYRKAERIAVLYRRGKHLGTHIVRSKMAI